MPNKYFLLVLFFLISLAVKANVKADPDSTLSSIDISASYHYGFIIAHRSSIVPLQQDHTKSFELTIRKITNGNKTWQQLYHYPAIGLKYLYINLGNPQQLGMGQALIPFIDLPFNKNKYAQLSFNFGWGIGYIQKPFNRINNYKNIAIGSRWNSAIGFSTDLKIKLLKKTFLNSGVSLTHFSNGSAATPNLGINVASVKIGLLHGFGEGKKYIKDSLPPFQKKFKTTVYIAGGVKQIYPVYGPDYYVCVLSAASLIQFTRKKAIGLGIDVHYDQSIVHKLHSDTIFVSGFKYGIRGGINGTYEFIFSDFSVTVAMGGYIYNKLVSDGTFYHRLGLRYQFTKNYFACFNLKSHWAKADFFEWGVGVKI
ncbi:MAG: acyloxyacyl hydrolase [Bacteroidota bacterium]